MALKASIWILIGRKNIFFIRKFGYFIAFYSKKSIFASVTSHRQGDGRRILFGTKVSAAATTSFIFGRLYLINTI